MLLNESLKTQPPSCAGDGVEGMLTAMSNRATVAHKPCAWQLHHAGRTQLILRAWFFHGDLRFFSCTDPGRSTGCPSQSECAQAIRACRIHPKISASLQKTPGLLAENTIGQNLTSNSRRQQEIINTGTSAEFIINTFKNVAVLTANERKRPCSRSGVPSASPAFDP